MASQCPRSGGSLQGGVPHSQESHNELFDSHHGKFDHTYSMSTEVQDEVPQCQLRNNEVLHGQTTSDLDKALPSKSLDNPNDADDLTNHVSAAHTHTATALTSDSRHVESISDLDVYRAQRGRLYTSTHCGR